MKKTALQIRMEKARKGYGANSLFMSLVCGFGVNGWRNYENGTKPNKAHENLILLATTPFSFYGLLNRCPDMVKNHPKFPRIYFIVSGIIKGIEHDIDRMRDQANQTYFDK